MSKKSLALRALPPADIVTRDDPYWLDVSAPTWQSTWTPPASLPVEPVEYHTEQATRIPSVGADVHVPFLQAVGTAIFIGVISGSLAFWLAWAWNVPVILAGLSAAAMWFSAVADTRALLRRVETFIGKDPGPAGRIGKQHTTSINVRVEQDGRGPRDLFLQFEDVRPEQLNELFMAVLRGNSMSESSWTGAGKLLSKKRFRAVRDGLMDADLLRWQNEDAHAQGLTLTKAGRAVLSRWCEDFARRHTHAQDGTEN